MRFLKKVEPIFTIIGAIATVVSLLISIAPSTTYLDRIRVWGSSLVAPKDYEVVPIKVSEINSGDDFALKIDQSASLNGKEAIFAITGSRYKGKVPTVTLSDQKRVRYAQPKIGEVLSFGKQGCGVTYIGFTKNPSLYSFRLKCN